MIFFLKGNALISGVLRFKPLDHQKRCIKLIENFFEIKNFKIANPLKGKGLIFITGLPRSGTTLMESIISSNELTFAGGELHTLVNLTTDTIDQMKSFNLDFIETIGDSYLKNVQFMNKNKNFFVDKMPLNYELIGLISVALPGAKIINMQRNFWDVAISQFQQYYVKNVPYSSNFFNIALVAANFEELIKIYSKEISPSTLLNLQYEDLVNEPHYWASRVYEFCEITSPYSPIQRSKHVTKSASQTQVKAEIHTQSLEKANFIDFHEDFLKNIDMQRSFWKLKRSSLN